MAKNKNLAATVALQLISMSKGKGEWEHSANIVRAEFEKVETVSGIVSNQDQLMLNKVLHSTRAMDTGMKTFLGIFDALEGVQKSMGGYLTRLRQGKEHCFGRMNGGLSDRIQRDVVDKRNRYLHAAGSYPTMREAEQIARDVESYLQSIINLV